MPTLFPITQSEIYIYNVEGTTDFPFAIIDGASHHAYLCDIANGYTIEHASLDWLRAGDYLCLAGQRCVVSGTGIRFVDFYFVTLTTPTIDFWGHPTTEPLGAAVPEPATWLLMVAGVTILHARGVGSANPRGGADGPHLPAAWEERAKYYLDYVDGEGGRQRVSARTEDQDVALRKLATSRAACAPRAGTAARRGHGHDHLAADLEAH